MIKGLVLMAVGSALIIGAVKKYSALGTHRSDAAAGEVRVRASVYGPVVVSVLGMVAIVVGFVMVCGLF